MRGGGDKVSRCQAKNGEVADSQILYAPVFGRCELAGVLIGELLVDVLETARYRHTFGHREGHA